MIADNNKSQSSSDVTSNNDNPNNNNQCTSDVTSNNDNPNNNNQPTSAVTPKDNNHQTTATVGTAPAPATPTHESTSLVKQFLQLLKPSSNESCYSEVSYVECYYPVVKLLFSQIPLHLYGCVINVS